MSGGVGAEGSIPSATRFGAVLVLLVILIHQLEKQLERLSLRRRVVANERHPTLSGRPGLAEVLGNEAVEFPGHQHWAASNVDTRNKCDQRSERKIRVAPEQTGFPSHACE